METLLKLFHDHQKYKARKKARKEECACFSRENLRNDVCNCVWLSARPRPCVCSYATATACCNVIWVLQLVFLAVRKPLKLYTTLPRTTQFCFNVKFHLCQSTLDSVKHMVLNYSLHEYTHRKRRPIIIHCAIMQTIRTKQTKCKWIVIC